MQMIVAPAQPALIDRYGRVHTYLRVSVTDRCNFRCVYCMPPEGIVWRPREDVLTFEEIERIVRLFVRNGVEKVRLTGGEPTVRKDIADLVRRIKAIPGLKTLAMTTNGLTLSAQAGSLRNEGLDCLNVSLDSLRRDRFERIARFDGLDRVLSGIDRALSQDFASIKINVVVMAGINDDEIGDFVDFAADRPITVRFIEYMPFPGNDWSPKGVVPYAEIRRAAERRRGLIPLDQPRGEVGLDFQIDGGPGKIGFVTSMTRSFCGDCNRIRLTADGQVKSCLFTPPESELRGPIRSGATDEELLERIQHALRLKPAEHPPAEELMRRPNLTMVQIGG